MAGWVERLLSLRETCRIEAREPFSKLVDLIRSVFQRAAAGLGLG